MAHSVGGAETELREQALFLIDRAAAIWKIRSTETGPLRLRAHIRQLGVTGGSIEGTYELRWAAEDRWFSHLQFPGYKEVRVGGRGIHYRKRSLAYEPLRVTQWRGIWEATSNLSIGENTRVKRISRRKLQGSPVNCVRTRNEGGAEEEFCFDATSGALLRHTDGEVVQEYDDYVQFGGRYFPRSLHVTIGKQKVVEATIDELAPAPDLEASVFTPQPDAEIWPDCANVTRPKPLEMPSPEIPKIPYGTSCRVTVYILIGEDGKVYKPAVVQSAGPVYDAPAITAARNWRFEPAKCGNVPIRYETNIHVEFFSR